MKLIDTCPICNSKAVIFTSPGFIHQLVTWRSSGNYAWGHTPTSIINCKTCSYYGPQQRLTSEEEDRYYTDYRGNDYTNMRIHSMPWYQTELETMDNSIDVANRIAGSHSLILPYVDPLTINSVLDYGGPRGTYIPSRFMKAKLYVYDRGTGAPDKGRIKFNFRSNISLSYIDFIMCRNMLDTSADPAELMNNLKSFMNKDSWLYIEVKENPTVPEEVFFEKVNYFQERTLRKLFEEHRLRVVGTHTYDGIIAILGKLK